MGHQDGGHSSVDVEHDDHWAELDPNLLDEIVTRVNYGDRFRLRAVCKRWSFEIPKTRHVNNLWLVLPSKDENEINRPLLNFGENIVYHFNLPETQKTIFLGSYFEWLVTLAIDGALQILNPFTRAQLELPPLTTFRGVKAYEPDRPGAEYTLVDILQNYEYNVGKSQMHTYHIRKIIISAPPDHYDQDFVAMAIYDSAYRRLAWCRIGDSRWIDAPRSEIHCDYEDAIFHEGKIYVVDYDAKIYEYDMKTGFGGISAVSPLPNLCLDKSRYQRKYLVGTPDGLLMVLRRMKFYGSYIFPSGEEVDHCYKSIEFKVYKFNRGEWSKINSLENHVVVLGQNCSRCVSSKSFPDGMGNRIYFTDDFHDFQDPGARGGHDIGVFNLEDGSITHLFPDARFIWPPPPLWLLQVH